MLIRAGVAAVVLAAAAAAAQTAPTAQLPARPSVRMQRFLHGRDEVSGRGNAAQALDAARRQHLTLLTEPRSTPLTAAWQPLGPNQVASERYGNITGRVTSIALDPSDATGNTVYVGTSGGGVWKSGNAAGPAASATFAPLTDTLPVFDPNSGTSAIPSLSIGAVAVSANGVVIAGTGDANDATDSFYGSGLLRSADGGATWTLIQVSRDGTAGNHNFFGMGVAGIAFSTQNASLAVAAFSRSVEGTIVNAPLTTSVMGLYYSTDAGVTWQMATIKDGSQTVQSPLSGAQNNGGNAATAVVWNPVRQRFYAAVRYHGYYESSDGVTWTRLANQPGAGLTTAACPVNSQQPGSVACPIFRGALAVQPVTGDLFALTVDGNNADQGLWQDTCKLNAGVCASATVLFAQQLAATPMEMSGAIAQGDYNLTLAATPSGTTPDTVLFAGTEDLFRCAVDSSGTGGCTLRNTTNAENGCAAPAGVAPAQHALAALLTSGAPLVYIGNDGGLWRSTDGVNQQQTVCSADDATHFENLNGTLGSLAEVVSVAEHPSDGDVLLAGLGGNGAAATASASALTAWPQLSLGESGGVAIDAANPQDWYVQTAAGVSVTQCTKGAACTAADFNGTTSIGATQVSGDSSEIDAPMLVDPGLDTSVLVATCRVWRGPGSGSAWPASAISPMLNGPQNAACNGTNAQVRSLAAGGPVVTAAAVQNQGASVVYAGMAGASDGGANAAGHVFATVNAGMANGTTAWTDLWSSPVTNDSSDSGQFNPNGFDVSSVVADAPDATGATVYATVMGFAGNGLAAPHVYQSIDAGMHWLNITANLPNAPANAVLVDPNDANTVYVAMDTGVYVTTQVSTCSTANCWSVYGATLPNAPVVGLAASAGLATGDGRLGELRAATYGRGIWEIPLVNAQAAQAAMMLSTASLSFDAQAENTVSTAQPVTVTNTGTGPLTVTSLAASGDFTETDNCTTSAIAVNGQCTVEVSFAPTATGARSGVLTIYGNVSGGQATVSLSGTGTTPAAIVLQPLLLTFTATTLGQTSAAQDITISNTGGTTAALQTPVATGDFTITANTCGASLASNVGCTVSIAFAPTASGTRTGTFSISDDAGTQTATLTGTGNSQATDTIAPLVLNFGTQNTGSTSAAQTVTLTNDGDAPLTLIAATVTGDFTVANNCGNSLNGHSSCAIQVSFAPTQAGTETGVLTISDQARMQTVALSGMGVAPPQITFTPASLTFATTGIGLTATPQTLSLTSTGGSAVTISSIGATGDYSLVAGTNTCAATLAVSVSCSVQVAFTPTVSGTRTGFVTVYGNMSGGHASAPLAGNAVPQAALAMMPASLTFASTAIGASSATQTITVTNSGGLAAALQPAALSGDFVLAGSTCGASLAANASCTLQIAFVPTASGTRTGSTQLLGGFSASPLTATLRGTGIAPAAIVLTPTAVSFAATDLGMTSQVQNITISNTGDAATTLQTPVLSGADFKLTANTCGASLAGQTSCTVSVAFAPLASGLRSGTLTVTDSIGTQVALLTGTGTTPATDGLAPSALTFAVQTQGTTSPTQAVTLTNTGDDALTLIRTQVTSGDFTVSNGCGVTLNGHTSCLLAVAFAPQRVGLQTGALSISDQYRTQAVALMGSGAAPAGISLSPTNGLMFAATGLGIASKPQTMTLTNNSGVTLNLASVVASNDFTVLSSGTCARTLAANSSCTVNVVFTPAATGARTGSLIVTDDAANSPQTVALSGTGIDFTLQPDGQMSVTDANGASAVYPLLLSSEAGLTGTVTFTCAGRPAYASCTVFPATGPLGTTTVISVTVQTGLATAQVERPEIFGRSGPWLVLLLPVGLMGLMRRRMRVGAVLLVLLLAGAMSMGGCGSGGRYIPPSDTTSGSTATPTPTGTYMITVTGSDAGLTRSVALTLVVQ